MEEIIKFQIGKEQFAVETAKIREIVIAPQITHLPNTEKWVRGVINLRGEVVPVIDLRIRFHTTQDPVYDERSVVMAVNTEDERMVGIVVDEVKNMQKVDMDELSQSPDIGTSIESRYIRGLLKTSDEMVVIMNIDRVLDRGEIEDSSHQKK